MYVNSHFAITTVTLAWIYLRRNERFYFVRNMFMVAMGIALVGYVALPDRAAAVHARAGLHGLGGGVHRRRRTTRARPSVLFNPYAAIPSMHVAFALMLGADDGADRRAAAGRRCCGGATRRW